MRREAIGERVGATLLHLIEGARLTAIPAALLLQVRLAHLLFSLLHFISNRVLIESSRRNRHLVIFFKCLSIVVVSGCFQAFSLLLVLILYRNDIGGVNWRRWVVVFIVIFLFTNILIERAIRE